MTKSIERYQKRTKRTKNVLNNLLLQGISISFLTVTRHSLNPPPPAPPPFINEMGGSQEWGGGGWFYKGVMLVGRGGANHLIYEDPYIVYLPFSNFVHPPSPHFPLTYITRPHCSFCCPVSLAKWLIIYIFFTSTLI